MADDATRFCCRLDLGRREPLATVDGAIWLAQALAAGERESGAGRR